LFSKRCLRIKLQLSLTEGSPSFFAILCCEVNLETSQDRPPTLRRILLVPSQAAIGLIDSRIGNSLGGFGNRS